MQNCFAKQISGNDHTGRTVLAVVVKQTYHIDNNGYCSLAEEQIPLIEELTYYKHNNALLQADLDLFVQKVKCDIIVKGEARCYGKAKQFTARVIVGALEHSIAVQGNQKTFLDKFGKIRFGDIEFVEEVPLRYDFAYGGKDTEAEKQIQLPPPELTASMPNLDLYADSPFRYPRNPEGKGYLVELSKNMVEQLEIPNIQDPECLLTPENILVGDINRWLEMPIPYATDWVSHVWVPRFLYTGLAEYRFEKNTSFKEMKNKWVEPDIYNKKELATGFNNRFFNGGHYALQIPATSNIRECKLVNIHPTEKNFTIKLPTAKPQLWVDGRKGKLLPTTPVMNTLLIEPDASRLSITWSGSAPALRPYMEEELKTMPYKVEWSQR